MDKVNVLIAHYFGRPADAGTIAAVAPRVEVAYAPYVDARAREMMRSYQAGGTMTFEGDPEEFDRRIGEAEVILGAGLPKNLLELAPNLKWVQAYGAGVDYLAGTGLLEHGVALTSSSGINGPPIAESCLMFMIMNEKSMVKRVEAQSRREWTRYANGQLTGKTVGIVGPGSIGGGVAKRAAACDMRVLAARRTYVPGQAVPVPYGHSPKPRLTPYDGGQAGSCRGAVEHWRAGRERWQGHLGASEGGREGKALQVWRGDSGHLRPVRPGPRGDSGLQGGVRDKEAAAQLCPAGEGGVAPYEAPFHSRLLHAERPSKRDVVGGFGFRLEGVPVG